MPTTLHVALEDALSDTVTKWQLSPSEERDAELELIPPSSVFELLSTEKRRLDTPSERSQQRSASPEKSPSPGRNEAFQSDRSSLSDAEGDGGGSARLRLSAGQCVTRAMEAASRRLSSSPAAASAPAPAVIAANRDGGAFEDGRAKDGAPTGNGTSSQQQQLQLQLQEESTEESEHIVSLIWSTGAEAYLDSIAQLVADVLRSLDDEVSRDARAAAVGDGGEAREAKSTEGEVLKDSKAGLLLARILSLGLEKQDVEDDGGGGEAGEAEACPLVRELYEKLGSFSSTHEKLDAVKTLLLAGCYFEGVRATSTRASRG